MKRVTVRPGKAQSTMGFVVGLIFCGIGLFVAIPAFGVFGIFWTLIAVAITVVNGINAFGKKGVATHEIEIDEDGKKASVYGHGMHRYDIETEESDNNTVSDVQKRIDSLKDLYNAGLITKEEFNERRNRIIDEATQ